jgi:hypothetical protein
MVWNGGTATFTYVHGDGSPNETLTIVPPKTVSPPMQFDRDYAAPNFTSSAQGGVSHFELPNIAGFLFPCGTGAWQTDNSGLNHTESSINISGSGRWTAQPSFGPTLYGVAFFPDVRGTVAAGIGSMASFTLHAEWGPMASRSILNYNYTITTPGDFEFAYYDWERTVPDFLLGGQTELIQFSLTLAARGIDSLSDIYLACLDPNQPPPPLAPGSDPRPPFLWMGGGNGGGNGGTLPVPEPSTYALMGLGMLALIILRRKCHIT